MMLCELRIKDFMYKRPWQLCAELNILKRKIQAWTGLESLTLRYRCNALSHRHNITCNFLKRWPQAASSCLHVGCSCTAQTGNNIANEYKQIKKLSNCHVKATRLGAYSLHNSNRRWHWVRGLEYKNIESNRSHEHWLRNFIMDSIWGKIRKVVKERNGVPEEGTSS